MVGRGSAGSLAALCVLLAAATARAEATPRLEYVVDASATGCPSEAEFREAVRVRLGREPFAESSLRRLRVEVWRDGGELAATGALVEADGSAAGLRRFAGKPDGCREVVDGMALAVSLALGGMQSETSAAPPPSGQESPPSSDMSVPPPLPPSVPVPARAAAPTPPPSRPPPPEPVPGREPLVLGVGLAGHAALGVGPGVGVGGSLVGVGRLAPWSVSIEARVDGLSGASFDTGGSVTTSLVAGLVAPCRLFGRVPLCLLGLAGSIRAASSGVSTPGSDSAPYAAAGARVGLDWPLADLLLFQARLDALVTLLPVDIEFAGTTVWSSSPFSGALGAGVIGLFP